MRNKSLVAILALLPMAAALAGCGEPAENQEPPPEGDMTQPSDTTPLSPDNTCIGGDSVAADEIDSHGSTEPDQVDRDPHTPDDNQTAC